MNEVIIQHLKINLSDVVFIKAILESYEGMALVRTTDETGGIIEIWINPHFELEINAVIDELASRLPITRCQIASTPMWLE